MGRLRANFGRLAHPMQDVHINLRKYWQAPHCAGPGPDRPGPAPDRAEGRLNPQARQAISLKDGKRYLRLPYLPVLPDPSAFFPLLS